MYFMSNIITIFFFIKVYMVLFLFNPLNAELNPICCLLALLGAHHFLHVSRITVKSLTLRLLMSYIYGAPILDLETSRIGAPYIYNVRLLRVNWSHPDVYSLKHSKSKFSQNTTKIVHQVKVCTFT